MSQRLLDATEKLLALFRGQGGTEGTDKAQVDISVAAVEVTDVTIKDATTGDNKLKVNADGSILAQVTGRKIALPANTNYGAALNIAAGGNASITITPPSGEIWRIKAITGEMAAPAGAGSGTYTVTLRLGAASSAANMMQIAIAYNVGLQMRYNQVSNAVVSVLPATAPEQRAILSNLVISATCPLIFYFANATDVALAQTPVLFISKEVEYIV